MYFNTVSVEDTNDYQVLYYITILVTYTVLIYMLQ